METKQGVQYDLEQKTTMSQEMQFSMKILQMSSMELTEYLHNEFVENPIMEIDESESDATMMDKHKLETLVKNREEEIDPTITRSDDNYVSPFEYISSEKNFRIIWKSSS